MVRSGSGVSAGVSGGVVSDVEVKKNGDLRSGSSVRRCRSEEMVLQGLQEVVLEKMVLVVLGRDMAVGCKML